MENNASDSILIVDDVPENLTLLSRILETNGYHVNSAVNGNDAIRFAQENLPDLILLDVYLPAMNGFSVMTALKNDDRTSGIPVIFISALDKIEDKVNAFRAGGVDYILKPFEIDEVVARVKTQIAIRRLRRQLESTNRELTTTVEELKRFQELLLLREEKLKAFVDVLPNMSFVYDENGRYLEILAKHDDLLAFKAEALLGHLIEEILPAAPAGIILSAVHRVVETGEIQVVEYKLPVLNGDEHWFEGRIALMERDEAGHAKVVLVATDISERVTLYEKVQKLANLDPLTGCFNRRYFMSLAEQEIHRALRYKRPLSLLLIDVDHFKNTNDRYGHQIGDQVLCSLVDLFQTSLRVTDTQGRYGGDELVILMPETNASQAFLVAERLRLKAEQMRIDAPGDALFITISTGVAMLKTDTEETQTLDKLISKADQALYAAKSAGRNCVHAEVANQ